MIESHGRGRRAQRWIAAILLGALLPFSSLGCFGRFELTHRIYRFNQRIDPDKWIQWVTFLVLNVIPIYGLAVTIDVLFANSVEFWTGSNPILAETGAQRVVNGPNGTRAVATRRGDGAFDLAITGADGAEHALTLVPGESSVEAWSPDGRLLATLFEVDGAPLVVPARP